MGNTLTKLLAVQAQEIALPEGLADAPPPETIPQALLPASQLRGQATETSGLFDTLSLFVLIPIGIVSISLAIVTLWMLIHAITKPITHKSLWILLIVFTGPIGAFVYLFTGRNSVQDAYLNLASEDQTAVPVAQPVAPIYTPPIPQPPISAAPLVQLPSTPVPPLGPPVSVSSPPGATEGVMLGALASEPPTPLLPSPPLSPPPAPVPRNLTVK